MVRPTISGRCILVVILCGAIAGCDDERELGVSALDLPVQQNDVQLLATKPFYNVDDSVVTRLVINNATNVGSVAFHLRFDPDVLQYVEGVEGNFLNDDGTTTVFLTALTMRGEVVAGMARFGGTEGASGAGVLGTLEFLAIGTGEAEFQFTGSNLGVRDPQARHLKAAFTTEMVSVVRRPSRHPVPEFPKRPED